MVSVALARASEVGEQYERGLSPDARANGAHYTPADVAAGLVDRALLHWGGGQGGLTEQIPRTIDLACGAGVFLVAVADALVERGHAPDRVIARLSGRDTDPEALTAARAAVDAWAAAAGHDLGDSEPDLRVGDALAGDDSPTPRFDLVIGNPPFQGQLKGLTPRTAEMRERMVARFGVAAGRYVDTAALFAAEGISLLEPDGVMVLIQPRSVLAASDAEPVRAHLQAAGELREVWLPDTQVFAAAVNVCALIMGADRRDSPVHLSSGRVATSSGVTVSGDRLDSTSWAGAVAALAGVPDLAIPGGIQTFAELAEATAGFRDEFYGVAERVYEDARESEASQHDDQVLRVVTSGAVDPATIRWGSRPTKIGGKQWTQPVVDRSAFDLNHRVGAWVRRVAVPKVVLATQTRVLEAAVDARGDIVPLTPVIAAIPTKCTTWQLAALLSAPPVSAWAAWRFGGSGLSAGAMRVSAKGVLAMPAPIDLSLCDEAVDEFRRLSSGSGDWRRFGELATAAYRVSDDSVVQWWLDRLPQRG
jgi:hypothetical protein